MTANVEIDEEGVADPSEFGDLFEGQTVAFENELVGHDADDMLGSITHDLGITSEPQHHQSNSHQAADHDLLANFVPEDYLHHQDGQQMVMEHHENSEYHHNIPLPDGLDGQQQQEQQQQNIIPNNNNNSIPNHQPPPQQQEQHQQNEETHPPPPVNIPRPVPIKKHPQQIYIEPIHSLPCPDPPVKVEDPSANDAQMSYEYNNYNNQNQEEQSEQVSQQTDSTVDNSDSTSVSVPQTEESTPEEPKVKRKVKVVKDVKYFTNENMERYLKRRGFKSKLGEVDSTRTISKAVYALTADSQIANAQHRLISFGSRYEPEYVLQEIDRFWKFYSSTKSKNLELSTEFLPMLIPILLHFYFEMMLAHLFPVARKICIEFSKKFHHEDKTQEHYDILVALTKVNSLEMLKTDNNISPLLNKKYEFIISEVALCHLRHFLSKSTHSTLVQLFTSRFKIRTRESTELIQSFDWEELDYESDSSLGSMGEFDGVNESPSYVRMVIEELRNSATAHVPTVSVYTTGNNPVCGNISKKGTLIAYGLQEAGIRICNVEQARDLESQPIDPDALPDEIDLEEYYGVKSLCGHAGTVYGVHFHPRTKLLFSVGQDSLMRAWDLNGENPRCRALYRGHSGPIWRMDIPESGSLVATAGLDTTARIFVPEKTEFVRIMAGHYCSVNAVKFHPNEAYIATGSADKSARLWSVHDGNIVRMFTGSTGSVNSVAFHGSGKYLAGAGEDDKIIIWDLAQGEVLVKLDALPNCRDMEFNGNMLSACYRNGMLQVFNLRMIVGGSLDIDEEVGHFEEQYLPSVSEPFTTKCSAKTLFKVSYLDSGSLWALGSDLVIDEDDFRAVAVTRAYHEAEEFAPSAVPEPEELTPIDNSTTETILQQVLQQMPIPTPPTPVPQPPPPPVVVTTPNPTKKRKKQSSGIVTVMGSDGSSRILAARLSQPIQSAPPPPAPISGELMDTYLANIPSVSMPETPLSAASTPMSTGTITSAPPTPKPTPQMITSAELDAAIASVIDQSGCTDSSDGGGTITMYASS